MMLNKPANDHNKAEYNNNANLPAEQTERIKKAEADAAAAREREQREMNEHANKDSRVHSV